MRPRAIAVRRASSSVPGGGMADSAAWSLGCMAERSEEHTSELQSQSNLVCRLLLEKKKNKREYIRHRPQPLVRDSNQSVSPLARARSTSGRATELMRRQITPAH